MTDKINNEKITNELLEILNEAKDKSDLKDYLSQIDDGMTFHQYMGNLIEKKELNKSRVIQDANILRTYGYQILDGSKHPGREKVIALCLSMQLTFEETQRALTLSGNNILYAKDPRDAIIIFSIHKHLTLMETNELLYEENRQIIE